MTERLKRPLPERERPLRSWSTLFGNANSGASPPAGRGGAEPFATPQPDGAAPNGAFSDVVDLGYRVVEEYLRQGQRVAEALGSPPLGAAAGSPEQLQQLAQRWLQYGSDFAGVWFEMWAQMASAGPAAAQGWPPFDAQRESASPIPPFAAAPADETQSARGAPPMRVSVAITCDRRAAVTLDVSQGSRALTVHGLRAEGHEAPVIRDVALKRRPEQDELCLELSVPREQPAGIYNALIVDAETNLPRGTLSLKIDG